MNKDISQIFGSSLTRGALHKKVSLKISQNFQENTCGLELYQKTLTQVFSCEICKILKKACFEEHLRTKFYVKFDLISSNA